MVDCHSSISSFNDQPSRISGNIGRVLSRSRWPFNRTASPKIDLLTTILIRKQISKYVYWSLMLSRTGPGQKLIFVPKIPKLRLSKEIIYTLGQNIFCFTMACCGQLEMAFFHNDRIPALHVVMNNSHSLRPQRHIRLQYQKLLRTTQASSGTSQAIDHVSMYI
jgi:hypothetical protein